MEQHELYKSDKDQLATLFRLILTDFLIFVLLHKVTTFVVIKIWHEKYFNCHVRVGSESEPQTGHYACLPAWACLPVTGTGHVF